MHLHLKIEVSPQRYWTFSLATSPLQTRPLLVHRAERRPHRPHRPHAHLVAPTVGAAALTLGMAARHAGRWHCSAWCVPRSRASLTSRRTRHTRPRSTQRRAWFGKSNQEKFESYVAQCSNYTERQLVCLPPRWRTLLKGIKAGLQIPSLVSAVQILYDDIMPLRMGSDLLSRQLDSKVREATARISSDIPDGDLFAHRELFDTIDADGSGVIKKSELDAFNSAVLLGPNGQKAHESVMNSLQKIITGLYEADQRVIDFPEFLEGAGRLICEDCGEPLTQEQTRRILEDLMPSEGRSEAQSDSKHDQRFDEIVKFIRDWEAEGTHLTANGRLGKVLEGSFAAAQDEEVVAALRFVYNDIAPFRIAGELIFGIVSRFLRTPQSS